MRIGIDIMGGDFAPEKTVHGAILAKKMLGEDTDIILFGKKKDILCQLESYKTSKNSFEIVNCEEVIGMGEHAVKSFKKKPNSSISIGFHDLSIGEIDGF